MSIASNSFKVERKLSSYVEQEETIFYMFQISHATLNSGNFPKFQKFPRPKKFIDVVHQNLNVTRHTEAISARGYNLVCPNSPFLIEQKSNVLPWEEKLVVLDYQEREVIANKL